MYIHIPIYFFIYTDSMSYIPYTFWSSPAPGYQLLESWWVSSSPLLLPLGTTLDRIREIQKDWLLNYKKIQNNSNLLEICPESSKDVQICFHIISVLDQHHLVILDRYPIFKSCFSENILTFFKWYLL